MSILIDAGTRVLVQGLTGQVAQADTARAIRYGTKVVAGVSPGKGGTRVLDVPVYDTVARAVREHAVDATMVYVPPPAVKAAVLEALDAGVRLMLVTAEYVPVHDVACVVAAARAAGARLIGCNTNGIIAPGKSRLGGIGGEDPAEIFAPGRIGICSRSGGMSAEIALTLKRAGYGVSTCVSMGGDYATGLRMADYLALFEADDGTDATIVFGEPGTPNEQEVAARLKDGTLRKPVVAIMVGAFQERYPAGMSFGHAAAMIASPDDTASAKKALLAAAGAHVVDRLEDIPMVLAGALAARPAASVAAPRPDARR